MTLVDKVLYIQHEGNSSNVSRGETTQAARFKEIQRTNDYLRMKYDLQIHQRVLELGGTDPFWVDDNIGSDIRRKFNPEELINFNHTLYV